VKRITLTFGAPQNVTPPNMQISGMVIAFPFTAVDTDLIGAPEEKRRTTNHRLKVTISKWASIQWGVGDEDTIKEIFELGRRQLVRHLEDSNPLPDEFARPMISYVGKAELPFVPGRLKWPDELTFVVEIRQPIGFKPVS